MNIEEAERIAKNNEHIPTAEILRDRADTLAEIENMQREIKGLRLIGDRMSNFKADNREIGIKERREFVRKLGLILKVRGVK
jgi:hypothetical protein